MSGTPRDLKIRCLGQDRLPHRRLIARISFWIDDSGERYLQDLTKIPDGSKRAEVLRLASIRIRREAPVTDGFMFRAPDGREHVVLPPGPAGRNDAIAEGEDLTWYFACPLCMQNEPGQHWQLNNRRVFRAVFAAAAVNELKPTIVEFRRFAGIRLGR